MNHEDRQRRRALWAWRFYGAFAVLIVCFCAYCIAYGAGLT